MAYRKARQNKSCPHVKGDGKHSLTREERELVELFRRSNQQGRNAIIAVARASSQWRNHLKLVP